VGAGFGVGAGAGGSAALAQTQDAGGEFAIAENAEERAHGQGNPAEEGWVRIGHKCS
jgi:hypothetical protein